MSGKSSFTASEWKLVSDAPQWVYAAVAAADGRPGLIRARREEKAFFEKLSSFKAGNALIKDVVADDNQQSDKFDRVSLADAEDALQKIGRLLDAKADDNEADGLRAFLLDAGKAAAAAAGEALFDRDNISDAEEEALNMVAISLRATDKDKRRRQAEASREKRVASARKQKEAEYKRKAAVAKRKADYATKVRKANLAKHKAEIAARKKAEAEQKKLDDMRAEVEAKLRKEAATKKAAADKRAAVRAAAKARRAKLDAQRKKARNAKVAAVAAAKAAAEAAKVQEQTYEVKAGDTLSGIALEVYGSAARWPEIFEANRDQVKSANLIRPGQKLRIP